MPSRRRDVLYSLALIALMSGLAGTFLLSGARVLTGGGWEYAFQWALIPLLVSTAVLHARRILKLLPESGR